MEIRTTSSRLRRHLQTKGGLIGVPSPAARERPLPVASPVIRTQIPTRSAPSAVFTHADIHRAFARGVAEERARLAKVFAAAASLGRERVCADLLTSEKAFPADRIVAALPDMPTDRQRAADLASEVTKAKARTIVSSQRGSEPITPNETAQRVLEAQRAYGSRAPKQLAH